jgi:hypothetical protein
MWEGLLKQQIVSLSGKQFTGAQSLAVWIRALCVHAQDFVPIFTDSAPPGVSGQLQPACGEKAKLPRSGTGSAQRYARGRSPTAYLQLFKNLSRT